jgi:pyridoxine 5-phosphate synthase
MRLHINVDHVATVRNARGTVYPDPIEAALLCIAAGADGITAHLREDRRHIRDADVRALRKAEIRTFNLEMAGTDEMVNIADDVVPDVVTFVPERRQERTTEGGLDVTAMVTVLGEYARRLQRLGIRVSLCIAPERAQIAAAHGLGVEQVELHTGEYASAFGGAAEDMERERLQVAATYARSLGLEVAAGHGLTRQNVTAIAAMPEIDEVNIGHSVIADALTMSLSGAVIAMRTHLQVPRP